MSVIKTRKEIVGEKVELETKLSTLGMEIEQIKADNLVKQNELNALVEQMKVDLANEVNRYSAIKIDLDSANSVIATMKNELASEKETIEALKVEKENALAQTIKISEALKNPAFIDATLIDSVVVARQSDAEADEAEKKVKQNVQEEMSPLAKFEQMTDPAEKHAFYKANKAEILKELKK